MIKKLKKRFIFTTMSIIGVIVIAIFTTICILTYNSHKRQTLSLLEQAASTPFPVREQNNMLKPNDPYGKELRHNHVKLPDIYTVKLLVSRDGSISQMALVEDLDEATLHNTVSDILKSEKERGNLSDANLMYIKRQVPEGVLVVFTSTVQIKTALKNTVIISAILCIISFIAFFILVERISNHIVSPFKQAWNSQKQFVADASHDLKTPLTVIMANIEILYSHKNDTIIKQAKWLDSTREEAEKMHSLVTQLLDLAKSENMQKSPELACTNLSEGTESCILQIEPVAFDKKISISSELTKNISIISNMEIYSRILETLLDNAIKYTKNSQVIKVTLTEDKKAVYLSVNNPSYIESENLSHIFERFYRSNKARDDKGYGLGLAIAKNLAQSINGLLSVVSTKENGTTFTLTLKKK